MWEPRTSCRRRYAIPLSWACSAFLSLYHEDVCFVLFSKYWSLLSVVTGDSTVTADDTEFKPRYTGSNVWTTDPRLLLFLHVVVLTCKGIGPVLITVCHLNCLPLLPFVVNVSSWQDKVSVLPICKMVSCIVGQHCSCGQTVMRTMPNDQTWRWPSTISCWRQCSHQAKRWGDECTDKIMITVLH